METAVCYNAKNLLVVTCIVDLTLIVQYNKTSSLLHVLLEWCNQQGRLLMKYLFIILCSMA